MMYQNKFVAVVKADGKIMREDKDVVYLPFGSEYALQFKNLHTQKAIVSIEIDGKNILGKGALLVEPNRTVDLERFVEDLQKGHKFKFIQKTKEIQDFRGDFIDDGFIRITFQFEKPCEFTPRPHWFEEKLNGGPTRSSSDNSKGFSNKLRSMKKSMDDGVMMNSIRPQGMGFDAPADIPSDDEGITVKGSESTQQFKHGHVGELEAEKHVMVLRLKGHTPTGIEVAKPVTVDTKLQCHTCGKTWNSKNKFCGNCGTALI